MTASIVGWAHTPFGKFDAETVESLVVKVATDALKAAPISEIRDLQTGNPQKLIMLRNLSRALEDLATLSGLQI